MKNNKTKAKILATTLISVVVFLLNAGVVGADDLESDTTYQKCKTDAETTYSTSNTKCQTDKTAQISKCENDARDSSITKCDDYEPGTTERINCEKTNNITQILTTCKSEAETTYQQCLLDNELQKTNNLDKCISEAKARANCGNKIVEYGEECDDGNTTKGDGCFECKKQDVFRVADWLKIDEGQTYLERSQSSEQSTSLKGGVFYFIITGIELATKIIGSLALLMIIVGGIVMMVSSGNSQLQQKGKRIILYSILGLVIAFLSLVIVTFVQSLFYTT